MKPNVRVLLAALGPAPVVEGRPVVRDGRLVNAGEDAIAAEGHRLGRRIAGRRAAVGSRA